MLIGSIAYTFILFPIPIYVENRFYKKLGIEGHLRKSIILNVISSIVGNLLVGLLIKTPFGHLFYIQMLYSRGVHKTSMGVQIFQLMGAIVLHYFLTVIVELIVIKVLKFNITPKVLLRANIRSYGSLFVAGMLIIIGTSAVIILYGAYLK